MRALLSVLSPALLWALALLWVPSAQAFGPNRDQPIRVVSDQAELDDQKGISTYRGDVVVTQGLAKLEADQIEIHSNQDGVTRIVATGRPAHYQEQESESAPVTHAYADTIIYTQANEIIELIDNARLEQGNNRFQGANILYDTLGRKVTARGNGKGEGRVEMIFHPQQKKPGAAEQ